MNKTVVPTTNTDNTFNLRTHFECLVADPVYFAAQKDKDADRKARKENEMAEYKNWYGSLTGEEQSLVPFSEAWCQGILVKEQDTLAKEHAEQARHKIEQLKRIGAFAGFPNKEKVSKSVQLDKTGLHSTNTDSYTVQQAGQSGQEVKPLATITFDKIEAKEIEWFWQGLIPYRFFTLCDGEEGIGKTYMLQERATDAARRGINTLWLSVEDAPDLILKPRFEKLAADCSRIRQLVEPLVFTSHGLKQLEATIAANNIRFVVIDPLFSFTGERNIGHTKDVRPVTDAFNQMANKHNCVIVGVRHFNKAKGFGDPRQAGAHSVDWRTGSRSVLIVGCDPDDKSIRGVAQDKLNISKLNDATLGYRIDDNGVFEWIGEIGLTKERMVTSPAQSKHNAKGKEDALERVLQLFNEGYSLRRIEAATGVRKSTADNWIKGKKG